MLLIPLLIVSCAPVTNNFTVLSERGNSADIRLTREEYLDFPAAQGAMLHATDAFVKAAKDHAKKSGKSLQSVTISKSQFSRNEMTRFYMVDLVGTMRYGERHPRGVLFNDNSQLMAQATESYEKSMRFRADTAMPYTAPIYTPYRSSISSEQQGWRDYDAMRLRQSVDRNTREVQNLRSSLNGYGY